MNITYFCFGFPEVFFCIRPKNFTMNEQEMLYRIALSMLPNVGPVLARALYQHCGSAEQVFKEKKTLLAGIRGLGQKRIRKAFAEPVLHRAEQEMAFLQKHGIQVVFYTEQAYPSKLAACSDAPVLMYFKGNADLNAERSLAIVGTRKSTAYGDAITKELVEDLSAYGVTIVSGLAYGIDIAAHRASLHKSVPTIGVTAHGLDRIYPFVHRSVAADMLQCGGLLTEYPSNTPPDRENFPTRNRIVAGMVDAVVVVEASASGGALITADLAHGYNRDVFAVPGRVGDAFSEGCNRYIRQNKAALVTSAADIAWLMGWDNKGEQAAAPVQTSLFMELSAEEQGIVDAVREYGECDRDLLNVRLGMSFSRLSNTLLQLELKGVLRLKPGNRYSLN